MYLSELLAALARQGIDARPWHIRHLLASRKIATPRRDAVGRFDFSTADERAIRSTLKSRGKKPRGGAASGGEA